MHVLCTCPFFLFYFILFYSYIKLQHIHIKLDSHQVLQKSQTSINGSRHSLSIQSEKTDQQQSDIVIETNTNVEPLQKRQSATESEDDIDMNFQQAKIVTTFCFASLKRQMLLLYSQGSQLSLNSTISENKARYDFDVNGTIQMKLSYNINVGALDIFIGKCYNLTRNKRVQSINPYDITFRVLFERKKEFSFSIRYCKVYLLPDKSKSSKRKTTIKKNTNEPIFNETVRVKKIIQWLNMKRNALLF